MIPIAIGKIGTVTATVNEANIASTMKSGALPVFATPVMIALMEEAAMECLSGCLPEGQSTVGTAVNIEHTAPSTIGAEITATATVTAVDRRRVDFDVVAVDNAGEIGRGVHTRFIIDIERFVEKVNARGAEALQ